MAWLRTRLFSLLLFPRAREMSGLYTHRRSVDAREESRSIAAPSRAFYRDGAVADRDARWAGVARRLWQMHRPESMFCGHLRIIAGQKRAATSSGPGPTKMSTDARFLGIDGRRKLDLERCFKGATIITLRFAKKRGRKKATSHPLPPQNQREGESQESCRKCSYIRQRWAE